MSFWKNKRVLITGHTGFKGSWLGILLNQLGADVYGIALPADNNPNLFEAAGLSSDLKSMYCDLRDLSALVRHIEEIQPEIVFHLAAQSLVRAGYIDPVTTFSTNMMGTVNLLEGLRRIDSVRAVVVVTTDKVYKNNEWTWPYRESDPLGGRDPYSASKSACELIVDCYRLSYFESLNVSVSTVRAGNVVGGGDWAKDRLIPDAVKAWRAGCTLEVRRPTAVRPWQHVLEPLRGYLMLAERSYETSEAAGSYNFGPHSSAWRPVHDVVEKARTVYGTGAVHYSEEFSGPYEAEMLALDITTAKFKLGFVPVWSFDTAIQRTIEWYSRFDSGSSAMVLCLQDIDEMIRATEKASNHCI